MNVALQRDYDWGKYFRTQWSTGPTSKPVWQDAGSCYNDGSCCRIASTGCTSTPAAIQNFNVKSTSYVGYLIKFAVGNGYYPLTNGTICDSPYDTGDHPKCEPGGAAAVERFDPYGAKIPFNADPATTAVPCEAANDNDTDYCSPWSSTYGMFYGDGTHEDVTLTVTGVEHDASLDGNLVFASGSWEHTFPGQKKSAQEPWTAFFIGGERLGRVVGKLQNNALGRFRLETRVNVIGQNQAPTAVSPAVVPITYTSRASRSEYGIMSTLQVAAHDMDTAVGGQDQVYFVMGTSAQHGAVLANQVPEGAYLPASKAMGTNPPTSPWHKAEYEAERNKCMQVACAAGGQEVEPDTDGYSRPKDGVVSCDSCPAGGNRWCRQITELNAVNGNLSYRMLPFSCADYPQWDNSRNLAGPPPRMSIDVSTGVITWETGIGPFQVDNGAYADNWDANNDGVLDVTNGTVPAAMQPLAPGFYSVVIEIRSASNDPDCTLFHSAAVCANIGSPSAPAMTYVSTTVDFLVYLHPTPAFCSAACLNTKGGIATFHDGAGFYGDAASTVEEYAEHRYGAPGSGRCAICGGGETAATLLDRSQCVPTSPDCVGTCPGIFVDDDGRPSGSNAKDLNCNTVVPSGSPNLALVPAIASCVVNRRAVWVDQVDGSTPMAVNGGRAVVKGVLGQPVTFDLILEDPDECNELQIDADGLFKGHMMLALPRNGSGITVCSEGVTDCGWDMILGQTVRVGSQRVKRTFTWAAKEMPTDANTHPDKDPRPRNTEVCFRGSDGYLSPARRCVNIVLLRDEVLHWRDQRPELAETVARVGFSGTTPANGTIFYVTPGNTLEVNLSAKQGIGMGPITVLASQGVIPPGATLTDNVSNEGVGTAAFEDPQSVTFMWTPVHGQECTYQVCFLAKNTRADGFPIDYAYTIETNPRIDERCYTIVVARSALALSGAAAWMDAHSSVPATMQALCGATVAMWFRAGAGASTSMPLITLGYIAADGSVTAWQQLTWHTATDGKRWALRLTDASGGGEIASATTVEMACTGEWHFAALTVEASTKNAVTYLDGTVASHVTPDTRNFYLSGTASLTLSKLPGDAGVIPAGASPLLRFGGCSGYAFTGELTGARAYKRKLSADEVASTMASPPAGNEFGLLAYYGFEDGTQGASPVGKSNRYAAVAVVNGGSTGDTTGSGTADSPLAPSVTEMIALGKSVRNTVSGSSSGAAVCSDIACADGIAFFSFTSPPDAPACPATIEPTTIHSDSAAEVTVTGSGFAKSAFLTCHFSNPNNANTTKVRASWVSDTQVKCKAPRVPYATVSAVEVANLPAAPSAQRIPLYLLQQVLSLRTATDTVTLSGICTSIATAQAFTFAAWVKPTSAKEGTVLTVVGDNRALTVVYTGERFELRTVTAGNKATVAVSAGAPASASGQPHAGWHFVAATLGAGGSATLLVDGVAPISGVAAFAPNGLAAAPGGSCSVSLGGATDTAAAAQGNGLAATLEDVTFWTKALTPCEAYGVMWAVQVSPETCPAGARPTTSPTDGQLAHFGFDGGVFAGKGPTGTTFAATVSGNAEVAFSATPTLPPTFNRPHAANCAPSTVAYANEKAFRYVRQRFAVGGTIAEPISLPAKCEDYAPEASPSKIPTEGFGRVTLKGFGFAESQWLQCQGEGGTAMATTYVGLMGVECTAPASATPTAAPMGVTNAAMALPESCTVLHSKAVEPEAAAHFTLAYVAPLHMLDPSLSLDGGVTAPHVSAPAVANTVANSYAGMSMGAWFHPATGTAPCAEQTIVCLNRACPKNAGNSTHSVPLFPLAYLCIVYVNGTIHLLSDSNTTAPFALFGYSAASITAAPGEWHYASVTVEALEYDPPLTGTFDPAMHTPRFAATLNVNGNAQTGDKVLVAGVPPLDGGFSFGGASCPGTMTDAVALPEAKAPGNCNATAAGRRRAFKGIVDEVRVFRGEPTDLWTSGLTATAAASAGAVAYFRMDPPTSDVSRDIRTYQPTSSAVRSIIGNIVGTYTVSGAAADSPTYIYEETPWTAASTTVTDSADAIDVGIDGGQLITIHGFNVAPTAAAGCLFTAPAELDTLPSTPRFVKAQSYAAGAVSCIVPRMGRPGVGSVRTANPGGAIPTGSARTLHVHEMALDFQGDVTTTTVTIGGSTNTDATLNLKCPTGLRVEAVTFAAYGHPLNRCTPTDYTDCDGKTATSSCNFAAFAVNGACNSGVANPASIVSAICEGKAECSYTPTVAIWGTPCGGQQYLSVQATCTDRWATRDFVVANDISASLSPLANGGSSSYTIMAWVMPRSGGGLRAVTSFGAGAPFRNRGIIQWDGASSAFYYYDDYVYDVAMRTANGTALTAASGQWHHVSVTVAGDNTAALYLNGVQVAAFSTAARPAADGTFIIGADLDDAGVPREFFDGMIDNFFAYTKALTPTEVASMVCSGEAAIPTSTLIAHYRFNGPATSGATSGPSAAKQPNEVKGGSAASLVSGTAFVWNYVAGSYAGTAEADAAVTPKYTYVGVPWYPAVVLTAAIVGGAASTPAATLVGGERVALGGINFSPGTAKVHYDSVEVSAGTFTSNVAAKAIVPAAVPGGTDICTTAAAGAVGKLSVVNYLATGARCAASPEAVTASVALARSLAERDINSGLIAHLPFYGNARDTGGTGNDGAVAGGAILAPNADGAANQAYRFPSAAATITVPNLSTAKSVAIWINLEEPGFPTFAFGPNSATLDEYLKCQNQDNGATVKGVWQFLAGSYPLGAASCEGATVWVNGVEPSTATAKTMMSSLLRAIISTGKLGGSAGFVGTVDAFWAWSRELCAAEVKRIYVARGSALRFDGVGGGVTASLPVAGANSNPGAAAFTLVAWLRPDLVAGRQTIIGQQLSSSSPPLTGFALSVDSGLLSAVVHVACPTVSCGCEQHREASHWRATLKEGRWAHVAATYDGTSWALYVDGALKGSVPFADGSLFSGAGDVVAPILIGAERTAEGVAGGPSEMRSFRGLIASASVWSKALTPTDVLAVMSCPPTSGAAGLLLHIELDDGVGTSGANTVVGSYGAAAITLNAAAHPAANIWATTTCGTYTVNTSKVELTGVGLVQGIAGNCAVFSIISRDFCGRRLRVGGDDYTVEILGPLHLHTELLVLTPRRVSLGGSIVDRGDGSYVVSYTRDIAGYYQVKVKLAGLVVSLPAKVYVHPYKANHATTYAYEDPDGHSSNELESAFAGRPATFLVQSVDSNGNLLASGGLTSWSLTLSGPETMTGTFTDLRNGAYRFSYHPQIPGRYTMTLTLGGKPICLYGGKECCSATRSSLEACSTKKIPADDSGACRFCLRVREDSSLNFGIPGLHATLPHHSSRDLSSTGFTISAWVRKPRASTGTAKEYIYSKRSSVSGKGYWLALLPTATSVIGTYELEGSVYVGGETYRIVRSTVTLPVNTWTHVAVGYSGTAMKLYVGEEIVKQMDWSATQPSAVWAVASNVDVTIGENFTGTVDNIKVFSDARAAPGGTDAKCPSRVVAGGTAVDAQLQTYLRMNEGEGYITLDIAGRATAATSQAIHGMQCTAAADGSTSELRCPAGSVVSATRIAVYGISSGACGTYASGPSNCAVDVSHEVMEACKGRVTCNLTAAAASLNGKAPAGAAGCGALSLTVEAVCAAVDSTMSAWAKVAAPSNVGVAAGSAASIVCPFDLKGTGRLSTAQELFIGNGTCAGWNLSSLTAGVAAHAAILAKDGCGYLHLPESTAAVVTGGTLAYSDIIDASIGVTGGQAACPATLPTRTPPPTAMSAVWYGPEGYCGINSDVHVLSVTPTVAGVAKLGFNLVGGDAFHVVTTQVGVDQGGMSATATRIIGLGIVAAEAGAPIEFLIAPADKYGNPVVPVATPPDALLNIAFSDANALTVSKVVKGANYAVTVLFPTARDVTVTVTVSGKAAVSMVVRVATAPPRRVMLPGVTNTVVPTARSMHAAGLAGSDVFVFGGALADRSYTNEMWRFRPGVVGNMLWRWRHAVTVTGIAAGASAVVPITLETGGAIAAGRMRADCADIRVVTSSGGADVAHFVEPAGAPSGCGSPSTLMWAKLTADATGKATVDVLYGNTAATSMSNPTHVFTLFEDFETGTLGDAPGGWALDFAASAACGVAIPDATTFTISNDVALSGTRSLKVSGATKTGGAFKRAASGLGNSFVLKGYLRDSACTGSFWISPDFTTCSDVAAGGGGSVGKAVLPATARAVGVHSCSTPAHYAATYPWEACTVPRTGGWHSLSFFSGGNGGNTTAVVDDITIARHTAGPVTMDRVFLWGSKVPDALAASDVYWDAIFAAPWSPSMKAAVGAVEAVAWSPSMAWSKVGITSPPSPRQGHSLTAVGAVGAGGELIAFGGERSKHYFSDIWRYTVATDAWEFVVAHNASANVARAEHTAVVHGSTLVIFGGRGGSGPKGDLWTIDFDTTSAGAAAGAWIKRATPLELTPRFGHTAAVYNSKMYVVGGYAASGTAAQGIGGLSSEVWSLDLSTYAWTFLGPRSTAEGVNSVGAAAGALSITLQFPAPLPAPRLSALSAAASSTKTMYLIGGVGGASGDIDMQDVWRLDLTTLTWSRVDASHHNITQHPSWGMVTRADGSMVVLGDGETGFVFGGASGGVPLSDLVGGTYMLYMG